MIFKDYYKILGLETNKVSISEIKNAYKEQAKIYHPDLNGGNKRFEERFKDINEAYKILSNFASKRRYDRIWARHVGKAQRKKIYEAENGRQVLWRMFFGNIFSKNKKAETGPVRGEDIRTEINISLEDAFFGKNKTISLRTTNGKMATFNVSIPAGIQNDEKIRLIGQGKKGKRGGKNGDLFINIKIDNDKKFVLDGFDLRTNLYLTPWEAALSTKVEVETIDDKFTVYIPAGTESGEEIRIENKGYKNGKGGRGDLILETKIMIPKEMTETEQKLFRQLKKESRFNPRNIA